MSEHKMPEGMAEMIDQANAVSGAVAEQSKQIQAGQREEWARELSEARAALAECRTKLEADPRTKYDGIDCRDETIRLLESALAEAERKCARLRFHAEAMAKDLELSYEVGESSLAAYQAEFKE